MTGKTILAMGYFLGRSDTDKITATVATIGTKVNDVVGTLDDFHVVLNDDNGVTAFYQGVEGLQQAVDIMEMQARCRLVKDKHRGLLSFLSDEVSQFDALVLTARECR
jgi:hypothetical protein